VPDMPERTVDYHREARRGAGGLPSTSPGPTPAASPYRSARITAVARTWLSIRVDLVDGGGRTLGPSPGDSLPPPAPKLRPTRDRGRGRLRQLGPLLIDRYRDDPPDSSRVDYTVKLSILTGGQRFVYVFDLGDGWAHLCTVNPRTHPPSYRRHHPGPDDALLGLGRIPDQYGRTWDGDDGRTPPPPDPQLADLPALHPGWGPRRR